MSNQTKKETTVGTKIRHSLQADCQSCFGLCCTALNILASSDFAINKPAGTPCPNLQDNYSCHIHSQLRETGFKGCTVFDCLGAGQQVSQVTFHGQDWRQSREHADKMFHVFPIMEQLYEMIAYVAEALSYQVDNMLYEQLLAQLKHLQQIIAQDADTLLALDMVASRMPINALLLQTSEQIRQHSVKGKASRNLNQRGADWMGKNLKGKDLRATDLRGSYLIAANLQDANLQGVDFIGADLRDANLRGADLSTSLFLTQMQINAAQGDRSTKLPSYIKRPAHWQ
ncbi:pentapeptide repeat-containing protein [Lysinibacillus capsici]|uniref:pentapeptide repeat-containing protein n=1 Tax=Lysinibacillus TaxID=400634 RepID=UPI0021DB71B5|nr:MULTISPECIES: pentapeptide repeat-containing protein [Lysinibacillus]UNT53968.1 pentapeptide repeat-containing protein [Lysinibacillus capsici]UYB49297.1 pentapeptide repeat-containing protein [Lysinibacillus capsici]WDU81249.1 pentapeptide repeat-containing protein [Lysinibacillus sp. G01H]